MFVAAFRVVITCVGVGSIARWPFYSALSVSAGRRPHSGLPCLPRADAGGEPAVAVGLWLFAADFMPALFGAQYAAAVPLPAMARVDVAATGW